MSWKLLRLQWVVLSATMGALNPLLRSIICARTWAWGNDPTGLSPFVLHIIALPVAVCLSILVRWYGSVITELKKNYGHKLKNY